LTYFVGHSGSLDKNKKTIDFSFELLVTLYNKGALISINSCLTNAQIILNLCVSNDYLSYSLMITTLGTN